MSGLSSQSLGTVWGRSLHSGLVAQIPHRGRDIFLELDSTHDVDLGRPDGARGLYLTVASVPTASSPMLSTMTMTKSERRIRVMAWVTVSSRNALQRPSTFIVAQNDSASSRPAGASVRCDGGRGDPPFDDHGGTVTAVAPAVDALGSVNVDQPRCELRISSRSIAWAYNWAASVSNAS